MRMMYGRVWDTVTKVDFCKNYVINGPHHELTGFLKDPWWQCIVRDRVKPVNRHHVRLLYREYQKVLG